MSGQQFFSEKEVGEIVKRAAEMQEKATTDGVHYSPGVSRDELARVAREMGIDPSFLDKAIDERTRPQDTRGTSVLGVTFAREYDLVIPGELPPEDYDVVMEEIGPRRKSQFTSQVGRMLTSQVAAGLGFARLTVSSRDGRTRIRARSNALFAGLVTLYPAFIAWCITAAHLSESVKGAPGWWIPALFGVVMGGAWIGFAAATKRAHSTISELTRRIAERVAQVTARQPAPADSEQKSLSSEGDVVRQQLGAEP